MGRKKKDPLDDIRKSLEEKLRACTSDQCANLSSEELLELMKQTREYAVRWANDCVRARSTKGTSVAAAMAESMEGRIEWQEGRLRAKEENLQSVREIKITYQTPDERVLSKQGAGDDSDGETDSEKE